MHLDKLQEVRNEPYVVVLILIVMEYALRSEIEELWYETYQDVLILIVMEYALRSEWANTHQWKNRRLNPYCNGICT